MRETKDYRLFYEQITAPFRKRPGAVRALRAANKILTGVMYAAYPLILLYFLLHRAPHALLLSILVPGISFVILSLVRSKINTRRPYEMWDIRPLIHKDTKGHSMPSRHIFSSAVISMVYLRFFPAAGIFFLILSAVSAVIRVIGGVHYPSDVVAGYLTGVLAGLLMFL